MSDPRTSLKTDARRVAVVVARYVRELSEAARTADVALAGVEARQQG
jgi:hypothetical protein